MTTQLNTVKALAQNFLNMADSLCENIERYFNGSSAKEDVIAYGKLKDAERQFINAASEYDGERYECCLDYELAESFLG